MKADATLFEINKLIGLNGDEAIKSGENSN